VVTSQVVPAANGLKILIADHREPTEPEIEVSFHIKKIPVPTARARAIRIVKVKALFVRLSLESFEFDPLAERAADARAIVILLPQIIAWR